MEGAFADALHTPDFDRSLLSAMAIYRNGGAVHLERGNSFFRPTKANLNKIDVLVPGDDFVVLVRPLPIRPAHATSPASADETR